MHSFLLSVLPNTRFGQAAPPTRTLMLARRLLPNNDDERPVAQSATPSIKCSCRKGYSLYRYHKSSADRPVTDGAGLQSMDEGEPNYADHASASSGDDPWSARRDEVSDGNALSRVPAVLPSTPGQRSSPNTSAGCGLDGPRHPVTKRLCRRSTGRCPWESLRAKCRESVVLVRAEGHSGRSP